VQLDALINKIETQFEPKEETLNGFYLTIYYHLPNHLRNQCDINLQPYFLLTELINSPKTWLLSRFRLDARHIFLHTHALTTPTSFSWNLCNMVVNLSVICWISLV